MGWVAVKCYRFVTFVLQTGYEEEGANRLNVSPAFKDEGKEGKGNGRKKSANERI